MSLPHIIVNKTAEGMAVEVEDSEVFDFVDDFLVEQCGIEYKSLTVSEAGSVPKYTMYFSPDIEEDRIKNALATLSAEHIEKIFNINNTK